jgi:hypothetical protein
MGNQKGKPSDLQKSTPIVGTEELSDLSESHQMTLHRPLTVEGNRALGSLDNSIEYHLTVRLTHETLGRRELSLLLEVLNYQVVEYGMNLSMYLALSDLYFRLLGNKRKSREIKDKKIRLTLTVSEIILHSFKGAELPLSPKEYLLVPGRVRNILKPNLMSKRTYGSRYRTWRPEKFFVVRSVPVDIQFLIKKKNSEPYSGYCKGYGESHPSAHSKKTKPSSELDGDGSNFVQSEEEFLFQRCTDPIHVLCEFLLIKYLEETEKEL